MRWPLLGCAACLAVACSLDISESEVIPTGGAGGASTSAGTDTNTNAGASGTQATTASGCTPHCPDGTCGDDGCHGTCPVCPGDAECMGKTCVACGPWLTTPDQVTLAGRLSLDGPTLYVGGAQSTASGDASWIGTFDACTARRALEHVPGARRALDR